MKQIGLLAACIVATCSTAQAQPIDGSAVEDILALATNYGEANLETQANGQPRIAGVVDGIGYQVFFLNCDSGVCEDLNFYAAFSDVKPTMDSLNAWNRDKRFGKAYLDADLDAAIEYDVNLEYGVLAENLNAAFGIWSLLLGQFAEYVGYDAQGMRPSPNALPQ